MSNQTKLDDAVGEVLEKIEKIDKSGFQLNSVLAISNNLDKQIKSQYSHFTSRIDKTRNDVLQNNKTY